MRKICYTVITGGYDVPIEPTVVTPGWEYLLLHDGTVTPALGNVWKRVLCPRPDGLTDAEHSRALKALPPFLSRKSWMHTVYVDGNVLVRGNLDDMLRDSIHHPLEVTTLKHPMRDCAYAEAEEVLRLGLASPESVNAMVDYLKRHDYPKNAGLSECGILIRSYYGYHSKHLHGCNLEWHEHVTGRCHRDQISFHCAYGPYVNHAPDGAIERYVQWAPHVRKE